jgi:DHA2 family multidrug resistance protein
VGANLKRLNLRVAASFGVLTMGCVGLWLAQLDVTASFFQLSAPRFLQGVGSAFFFMPIQQIMFSDLEPQYLAAAAGISNFARTISVSIATAGSIWLWSARTTFHHAALAQHVAAGPVWDDWSARLSSLGIDGAMALAHTDEVLTVQARVLAANDDFWFIALLLAMVVPAIWLARPPFRNFISEPVH